MNPKLKFLMIFIDLCIFSLFLGAAIFEWHEAHFTEVVVIDTTTKTKENVSNPFYVNEKEKEKEVVAVPINNVADVRNWVWPTEKPYTITSYYQYRSDGFHDAIDIYSYSGYGSNVYSANNGTVVAAVSGCTAGYTGCNSGRGNYVVISHNNDNFYTIYMHLSSIDVSLNQNVKAGDIIAKIGNTGNVWPVPNGANPFGGTHLHFGVFKGNPLYGGSSINPLELY